MNSNTSTVKCDTQTKYAAIMHIMQICPIGTTDWKSPCTAIPNKLTSTEELNKKVIQACFFCVDCYFGERPGPTYWASSSSRYSNFHPRITQHQEANHLHACYFFVNKLKCYFYLTNLA